MKWFLFSNSTIRFKQSKAIKAIKAIRMTSIDNSAAAQSDRIRNEICELQEQIRLWKVVPLPDQQEKQMQQMIVSVGPSMNKQSYIDSNVRCLEGLIEDNQVKIEKLVASGNYRKNLRSGSSRATPQPIQPSQPIQPIQQTPTVVQPQWCTACVSDCSCDAELTDEFWVNWKKLTQLAEVSRANDRNGVDPAIDPRTPRRTGCVRDSIVYNI